MPSFGYVAVNPLGKIKKGSIEAEDLEQARAFLKRSDLTAIELKEQGILTKDIDLPFLNRVKARDLGVFCRQFVSIVSAGIPIYAALTMLASQTQNVRLKKAILDTHSQIEKGESLSDALRLHSPDIFPAMMINMVAAGEASGNLEKAFARLADHFEKGSRIRGAVKKAMVYPTIVLVVVIAVVALMMVMVIPSFTSVFVDMDMELPWVTKIVMGFSDWMVLHWWKLFLGIFGVVFLLILFGKTDKGRHFFGKLVMKLPLFGDMTVKSASANFARTLSTLVSSGLPMLDSLEITAKNMSNIYFKEAVLYCRDEAATGANLSTPLENSSLFPPMVYHMTGIGEETGDLEEMLDRLADYYDEEVEAATKALIAALEPAIILLMAGIVGIVVCAILLPMFSMYDALGGSI
ncbi:MAG: type II secretion system F family protein [Clostridia bacterium]|nr:type II secretion system F family protein [Clostridia bacterium]